MRGLRLQYFLTFGVLGTVLPYASVFFRQAGLSEAQVGYAWAVWSLAVVLSPVLVTMAADGRADPRRLLVLASAVSGASLLALGLVRGVGPVLAVWAVYCLVSLPVLPLMDGVHFSQQRRRLERGGPDRPYHLVRVWGTIGFIVPSVLLFVFLQYGMDLRAAMMTGAAYAAFAALQARWLEDPRPPDPADAAREAADERRLPTARAAKALLQPHLLVFTAAVLLVQMAGSVHAAFYPVYLTERLGLDEKWLGQVSNLAVVIEMFFVFGCGALARRLGVKRLLFLAAAASAVRWGLVGSSANVWVVVGTQAFHGIFVLMTGVLPQTVLDRHAGDRFRHSMQGVFVMVTGAGRMVASTAAGAAAEWGWDLGRLFGCAALLCCASAALILFAYREPAKAGEPADKPAAGACPTEPLPAAASPATG